MSATIWFTGLSGSGKTTIAQKAAEKIRQLGNQIVILDGDEVRKSLSKDLGYSIEDRNKHITRVADVCSLITKYGVLNIACVVSPTKKIRDYAKSVIPNIIQVYIKCDIEECKNRDPKGHYQKVAAGEIKDFVGIDLPYEEPEDPDLIIETDKETADQSVHKLLETLKQKEILK
tara:strand:+ start:59 stop:580 length:522 start_codon:yes stop_codon:yes gene_type:complete